MSYLYNVNSLPVGGDLSTGTVIPTGTGATSRTLRARIGDVIYAADFGVQANGSSDDTTAWTNAFNAAVGTTKYVVMAPAGVSIISTITIPVGVTLVGVAPPCSYPHASPITTALGSVLKKTSGSNSAVLTAASNGAQENRGCGMMNMTLIGDGTHHGVTLGLGIPFHFRNCVFINCNAAIEGNTNASGGFPSPFVQNCQFALNAIGIWNVGDARIEGCGFNGNSTNGMQFDAGAQDNIISGCRIEFNQQGMQVGACEDMMICHNEFDSNTSNGLVMNGALSSVISSNIFRSQTSSMTGTHLSLTGCTDVTVIGNTTRMWAGQTSPTFSVVLATNNSVVMFGNSWRGHTGSTAVSGSANTNGNQLANVTSASPLNIGMSNLI